MTDKPSPRYGNPKGELLPAAKEAHMQDVPTLEQLINSPYLEPHEKATFRNFFDKLDLYGDYDFKKVMQISLYLIRLAHYAPPKKIKALELVAKANQQLLTAIEKYTTTVLREEMDEEYRKELVRREEAWFEIMRARGLEEDIEKYKKSVMDVQEEKQRKE